MAEPEGRVSRRWSAGLPEEAREPRLLAWKVGCGQKPASDWSRGQRILACPLVYCGGPVNTASQEPGARSQEPGTEQLAASCKIRVSP